VPHEGCRIVRAKSRDWCGDASRNSANPAARPVPMRKASISLPIQYANAHCNLLRAILKCICRTIAQHKCFWFVCHFALW
jgi:hypothetical protein